MKSSLWRGICDWCQIIPPRYDFNHRRPPHHWHSPHLPSAELIMFIWVKFKMLAKKTMVVCATPPCHTHTHTFSTILSLCQSPLKWFTWLKTSTTSSPTAWLIGPWPWKPCVGRSRKSARDAIPREGFLQGKMPTWLVYFRSDYRDVVARVSPGWSF